MTYSSTDRNRYRVAVAAVSGVTAVAAFSASGWLAGAAARSTESQQADQATPAAPTAAAPDGAARGTDRANHHRKVVLRQRPHRTRTTIRYVQGTPSAPVGSGGTVSQPAVQHAPAPAPHPAPQAASHPAPQPAPAPPPAPSTGS
jgi:hypothetical protein